MSVIFSEKTKTFLINSLHASYAFSVGGGGILEHRYFGARISGTDLAYMHIGMTHASFSAQNADAGFITAAPWDFTAKYVHLKRKK